MSRNSARLILVILAGLAVGLRWEPALGQTASGPITAWGFNEGGGTVAADSSGNGNAGTIVGATWTAQGRFGGGLVFNGSTGRVRGPSVAIGSRFTLMAWVLNPSRAAYETIITVGGSRDFHLQSGVPTFYTGNANLFFGNALADGVWQHMGVVSDGTTLRAYRNGAPWGTPRTVALGPVTGPLQVGAWIFGTSNVDYFAGTIDEVRVYNRALAQTEVQSVMNVPVGGSGPVDQTRPTVAVVSPAAGATLSGVVTLQAEASDNVAVAAVQFFIDGVALGAADSAAPWTAAWNTASATAGQHTITALARDTTANETMSAPVVVNVNSNSSSPAAIGQWGPVLQWPIAPVHMLLQRTGQVLIFDEATGGQSARLWNPATGTFTAVPTPSNLFCTGHAQLADGRSIVIGGQLNPCCYTGIEDTNLFNATTRTWTRVADMNFPRWYPTATTLPDGRILAISGYIVPGQLADTPEVYDPALDVWTQLAGATLRNPMYSFMFVLPDGTVLNAGPDRSTRRLDIAASRWINVGDSFISGHSAVMYRPGRVMKSGTHGDPDNPAPAADRRTVVLDMTQPAPGWREVAPMAFPRAYHNLTILPDGTVLATGGERTGQGNNLGQAVYEAELWNPTTETWSTMARMQRPRLYHSGSLLLPDGRVLMAGGNLGGYFEPNAQVYSPPYLFKGARPTITAAPTTLGYGARFFIETPDTARITGVTLVRTGTPTHGFDQNQRYLSLSFAAAPNGLDVTAPADARVAPPGDYMLFVLNASGVPSVARFVRLAASTP